MKNTEQIMGDYMCIMAIVNFPSSWSIDYVDVSCRVLFNIIYDMISAMWIRNFIIVLIQL